MRNGQNNNRNSGARVSAGAIKRKHLTKMLDKAESVHGIYRKK